MLPERSRIIIRLVPGAEASGTSSMIGAAVGISSAISMVIVATAELAVPSEVVSLKTALSPFFISA